MLPFTNRHRRTALALLSLCGALLVSVIVLAVPGSNSGQWVLSEDFECVNSALYCVVWEFSPGVTNGELCCVTAENYAFNVPSCSEFRVEPISE